MSSPKNANEAANEAREVLREFVADIAGVYPASPKDGDRTDWLGLNSLREDWPDLLATFHNAQAALARHQEVDP